MSKSVKNLPEVLVNCQAAIKKYIYDGRSFPALRFARISQRVERKESRENITSLLGSLFYYTDLATGQVGIPQHDGSFKYFGVSGLAKKAGLRTKEDDEDDNKLREASQLPKRRGYRTFYRHIAKLKAAGLIVAKYVAKLGYTVYSITNEALRLGGTSLSSILHARNLAKKRQEKRENDYARNHPNPAITTVINRLKGQMKVKNPPQIPPQMLDKILPKTNKELKVSKPKSAQQLEKERQWKLAVAEIKFHPDNRDLTIEQFYAKYPRLKEMPSN